MAIGEIAFRLSEAHETAQSAKERSQTKSWGFLTVQLGLTGVNWLSWNESIAQN